MVGWPAGGGGETKRSVSEQNPPPPPRRHARHAGRSLTFELHVAGVTVELLVSYSDLGAGCRPSEVTLAVDALGGVYEREELDSYSTLERMASASRSSGPSIV